MRLQMQFQVLDLKAKLSETKQCRVTFFKIRITSLEEPF